MTKPSVLFLCTHNAGRSQMALGYFDRLAGEQGVAWSGGSEPADQINPTAVAAMAEVGIDITGNYPIPRANASTPSVPFVTTSRRGCAAFSSRSASSP
jgi:arsenate reductase